MSLKEGFLFFSLYLPELVNGELPVLNVFLLGLVWIRGRGEDPECLLPVYVLLLALVLHLPRHHRHKLRKLDRPVPVLVKLVDHSLE